MDPFRTRETPDVSPPPPAAAPPPPSAYPPEPVPVPAYVPPRAAWAERADRADFSKWAFFAGLASGLLILLCAFSVALVMMLLSALGGPDLDWVWAGDPDGEWSPVAPFLFALWGLLAGGAVLLGALRLKENPQGSAMPGVVMVLGGLMSFLSLGGFFVGGILAIIAGAMAIAGARSVLLVRGPRLRGERPPSVP